jgi:hypothetical protein
MPVEIAAEPVSAPRPPQARRTFSLRQHFRQTPHVIRDPGFHRRCYAHALMRPAEVCNRRMRGPEVLPFF